MPYLESPGSFFVLFAHFLWIFYMFFVMVLIFFSKFALNITNVCKQQKGELRPAGKETMQ